jgi:hypothetical protein
MVEMTDVSFNSITIYDLESLGSVGLDELKFGVIGFDRSRLVDAYNTTEAQLAGLDPKRVVGGDCQEFRVWAGPVEHC